MMILHENAPADLKEASRLRREAARKLRELRMAPQACESALLVISEALSNIALHATPSAGFFGLRIELDGAALRIEISDDGGSFERALARIAAARMSKEDPGCVDGRGLRLIGEALTRVDYVAGPINRLIGWLPLGQSAPHVLVVEDDPTLLDLYAHYLRDWRVLKARSLHEALLALESCDICAIVADVNLGDGLGSSLVAALYGDPARTEPIVFVSAAAAMQNRPASQAAEAFLTKPVSPQALRAGVDSALARSAYRAARHARAFARKLDGLFAGQAPAYVHGHDLALARCSAGVGGGDLLLTQSMDDRMRLTLVDVMGHGVAAKGWAIAYAGMCLALGRVGACEANDYLLRLAEIAWREAALDRVIATALVIDVMVDGELRMASAGHPRPVVAAGARLRSIDVQGPLLGVTPPGAYSLARFRLGEGERLVAFTDGVGDADAAAGGPAPDWLLRACLAPNLFRAPDALTRTARARLGAQPKDDWTVLVLGGQSDQA